MIINDATLVVVLGLACVYTLISSSLIYSAVARITGKELRHLMITLFITVASGFFYGLFKLLEQIGLIDAGSRVAVDFFSNFLLFAMFVMLVYLSFLTRELGKRFGFRVTGKKIKERLESKKRGKHRLKH